MRERETEGPRPAAATPAPVTGAWQGRTVALCVTGSIAAYKAVELARLLVKAGARVLPVMTASAARFVGPVTLAGICGEPVVTDMWDASFAGEMHVRIAERADLIAIVPATADVLSRLAHGRADDLVTALALGARGPVLVAPAMHPRMWNHPATQRNVADLSAQGRVTLAGPERGEVASGDEGMGRMMEPASILAAAAALLTSSAPASGAPAPSARTATPADLASVRIVVTAGPTLEDIDPVRFIGNRSSGKMGFAVAELAVARGADVTLIAGPVHLPTPPGVRRVDVRSALEMRGALWAALRKDLSGADALVMAAAVADHRPAQVAATKIKKVGKRQRDQRDQGDIGQHGEAGDADGAASIELVTNPDLLGEVGEARAARGGQRAARPVLVGFAVETAGGDALIAYARRKLREKRVDLVVANEARDSFGREDNRVVLVTGAEAADVESVPLASKSALAHVILDRVRALL